MMRVTHVIDGLEVGGAEKMLASLLSAMDLERFRSEVISLTDIGPVGAEIERLGIPVRSLNLRPRLLDAFAATRLLPMLRWSRPDLVQTWLYESDLLGGIAARLARPSTPVIWSIHQANLDPSRCKRRRIWAAKACGLLSPILPVRIISCSEVAAKVHVGIRYAPEKVVVIPNAVDVDRFVPAPAQRSSVRRELGLPDESLLVGLTARMDPQKDHRGFLRAAAVIAREVPAAHFVLCGKDITRGNTKLSEWMAEEEGLRTRCHLLGLRHDMARIHASLDVAVSSSSCEALPVALVEAMACGVPCATTDVGDSGLLVNGTGEVVPPDDPQALACGVVKLLTMEETRRRALGAAARQRVIDHYSLPAVVDLYQALYDEVVSSVRGPAG